MARSTFVFVLLALVSCLAFPASAQDDSEAPEPQTRVLVWLLRNDLGEGDVNRTVTDMVTAALQRRGSLDVVTLNDVSSIVDVEKLPSLYGCPSVSTCFRPIAKKMGVRLVVTGSVGKLENTTIVNFSLYDADEGRMLAGESLVAATIDEIPTRLRYSVNRLFVNAGFDNLDVFTFIKSPFFVGGMTTFFAGVGITVGSIIMGQITVEAEKASKRPDPSGPALRLTLLGAAAAGGVIAVVGLGGIGWSLLE